MPQQCDDYVVSVKCWVVVLTEFVAEMMITYTPVVVGVPERVPDSDSVTPFGSPVAEKLGAGYPVAMTWKEKCLFAATVS